MPKQNPIPPDAFSIEGGICPVCGKHIRSELLLCGPCYQLMSQSDKTKVGKAWRKYRDFPTDINFQDMRAVQRKAVAAILEKRPPQTIPFPLL